MPSSLDRPEKVVIKFGSALNNNARIAEVFVISTPGGGRSKSVDTNVTMPADRLRDSGLSLRYWFRKTVDYFGFVTNSEQRQMFRRDASARQRREKVRSVI